MNAFENVERFDLIMDGVESSDKRQPCGDAFLSERGGCVQRDAFIADLFSIGSGDGLSGISPDIP